MAFATRRTSIANPAHRKRKMSPKQIRIFGTKRQKAALRAKHRPRHNAPRKVSHRKRNSPRAVRRNFGEVVSLTLGSALNPASKGKATMAKRKHHRKTSHPRPDRRRSYAHNPARHHRARTKPNRRRSYRRNPMGQGWGAQITSALYIIAGAVGSKLGAQAVLGTKNTGFLGYGTNLAVGGVLAWVAKGVLKNAQAAREVFAGSVVQVVLRLIADYTPFGQYTSQLGMGDYLASNWVSPQRYTDALHSAQVQIPSGWAPTTVIQSAAPPAAAGGMSGLYEGSASLY